MPKLDDDIDALFKLPLTEFVGARKALVARLKQNGFVSEAEGVKALAKPSISAWTVNQLYWRHREVFDELIATGQRFRKAQATGKMLNMREALDARREALSHLSDLATEALRDAGHNPSLDTLRRIGTTLEALSAATSLSDRPTLGRLTHDIDPPGFDSFGSFTPSPGTTKRAAEPLPVSPSKKVVTASKKAQGSTAAAEANRREARQARINAAKASLQQARKSLTAARAAARSLEGAQKKAEATAKEAAQTRHEAEERFKKASAASAEAALRAQSIAVELTKATKMLDDAQRTVESATKELENSFRESA
jgi:chemotaxis protein histidine kinase CheA